jgi:hypothetical protein
VRLVAIGVGYLLFCPVGLNAQHAARSPAADRYAQVRAVLSTDSVVAALAGRPVLIDPAIRFAASNPSGRKLQTLPVAFVLIADSVPTLGLPKAVARRAGVAESAPGDTVLITVAYRGSRSSPEYVVQLRDGADWTGYQQRTVALRRRRGQWHGRQVMLGMP